MSNISNDQKYFLAAISIANAIEDISETDNLNLGCKLMDDLIDVVKCMEPDTIDIFEKWINKNEEKL